MKPEIKEILLQLPKTSQGQALKVYLDSKIDELSDISTATDIEDVKGRQYALKLLKGILFFYGDNAIGTRNKPRYD